MFNSIFKIWCSWNRQAMEIIQILLKTVRRNNVSLVFVFYYLIPWIPKYWTIFQFNIDLKYFNILHSLYINLRHQMSIIKFYLFIYIVLNVTSWCFISKVSVLNRLFSWREILFQFTEYLISLHLLVLVQSD